MNQHNYHISMIKRPSMEEDKDLGFSINWFWMLLAEVYHCHLLLAFFPNQTTPIQFLEIEIFAPKILVLPRAHLLLILYERLGNYKPHFSTILSEIFFMNISIDDDYLVMIIKIIVREITSKK